MRRNGFYLQSYDQWQVRPDELISEEDLGRRCRGSIQFLRLMPSDPFSGMEVWISSNEKFWLNANFYPPCYMSAKEAYQIAWRVKRLFDRVIENKL